jgi:hypothetical protein
MDTENQVGLVIAQNLKKVTAAKGHVSAVDVTQQFHERVKSAVQPRSHFLDLVVEPDSRAVQHGGFLKHLLDPHIDLVPVKLKTPFGESLRPCIMTAAGRRGEDENANLRHGSGLVASRANPRRRVNSS